MKRLPLLPTLIVLLAVATMIGLGVWQLQRRAWKEGLIDRYRTAAALPAISWPDHSPADEGLLYRKAEGICAAVTGWSASAGRNRAGEPGWSHIAACRTLTGGTMQADMGWSHSAAAPQWPGGPVSGIIAPDKRHSIRLVSAVPAPGLEPSAAPDPADTPNNHLFYAIQWFFFAAAAATIYALALKRRNRGTAGPTAGANP